jgi:HEAT repeat protein
VAGKPKISIEKIGSMARANLEDRIEQLRELGRQPVTDQTRTSLRKALGDRSNLVVAQAAKVAGALQLRDLIPDLLQAFDRILPKGSAADPKCWAKKALVDVLKKMDHDQSDVFLRGLRHIQMEPVWGGHEDAAISLRGSCALALPQCVDISRHTKLRFLVDAMADPEEPVRVDAVRAIEQMEGDDGALLLRLKARVGDADSRVTGQVLESIINVEGDQGIAFVCGFLESEHDAICEEAALVLGASRSAAGFAALKEAWSRKRNGSRSEIFLRAISASGLPDAIDFLVNLIKDGPQSEADGAVRALELYSGSEEIEAKVRQAVKHKDTKGQRHKEGRVKSS